MREAQAMPGPAATALEARLERGEPVLLDGGIGTELEARGARMDDDAWSAVANVEAFESVQQVHMAARWLSSGARILGGCCGTRPEHIQALHDELVLPRRDGE
jgi:S-methylmethionine-dependent homocysteine/selenocysteine methylase